MLRFSDSQSYVRNTTTSNLSSQNCIAVFLDFKFKDIEVINSGYLFVIGTGQNRVSAYFNVSSDRTNAFVAANNIPGESGRRHRDSSRLLLDNSKIKNGERAKIIIEFADSETSFYYQDELKETTTHSEVVNLPSMNSYEIGHLPIQELYNLKIYNRKLTEKERLQLLK